MYTFFNTCLKSSPKLDFWLQTKSPNGKISLWKCYFHFCWTNFTLGGVYKLFGDLVGLAGPLGISIIIQYVANGTSRDSSQTEVSITSATFKWMLHAAQMHRAVVMHMVRDAVQYDTSSKILIYVSRFHNSLLRLNISYTALCVFKWSHCLHRVVRLCSRINNLAWAIISSMSNSWWL